MGNLAAAIVTVTPFQQNCTLLWDDETKRGVVIDPGGELQRIEEAIAEVGMVPEFAELLRRREHVFPADRIHQTRKLQLPDHAAAHSGQHHFTLMFMKVGRIAF